MNTINTKIESVRQLADFAMQYLDIDGVTLTIVPGARLLQRLSGPDYELHAAIFKTAVDHAYQLVVDCYRPASLVICHEMVHLKQYEDGRLSIDKTTGNCNWEGDTFTKDTPYYQRPWEEEAFGLQSTIYKQFKHR